MTRFRHRLGLAAFFTSLLALVGNGAGRFDQKLAVDKQIVHVLNRLTFGPRPGDVAEVRRIGLEKWIDLQLHPDRIQENPILETKLKPLDTLELVTWQINDKYPAVPPALAALNQQFSPAAIVSLLPSQQFTRLNTGSVEERQTILMSLSPEVRAQVLTLAPPQVTEDLPAELKQEAAKLRQAQQEERQKQLRRLMPPLNELLTPDQTRIARNGSTEEKRTLLNSFDPEKRRQVLRALGPQPLADLPDLRREAMAANQPQQVVNSDLIDNKLNRAIYSNRQLQEVLVDFWVNHFNVFNGKGPDRVLLTSYERDAIRPYIFGHFKDMLLATAHHPAMLFYLDNWQSQVPRDDAPQFIPANGQVPRRPGLNENYGRELMELHTLGVNGGYTQEDVIAVARAFSGWSIYDQQRYAEFQFNPQNHDRKEKVVLGHTLPAGRGEQDGLDVIDILVHHPSTAKFISKKLAQRFVADDPPETLVTRMADTFMKTDGDLRAVLQTMFSSVEFISEGAWQAKLKSPLEMVVSAARALNADAVDAFALAQRIADLGEPLYGKVEPTGYPNTGEGWASTAGILGRINFATALTSGQMPGIKVDISRFNFKPPATVAAELLSMTPTPAMLAAIEKGIEGKEAAPSTLAAVVLSSPEFQRR